MSNDGEKLDPGAVRKSSWKESRSMHARLVRSTIQIESTLPLFSLTGSTSSVSIVTERRTLRYYILEDGPFDYEQWADNIIRSGRVHY